MDKEHSIYITGNTTSTDIATAGAYQASLSGSSDIMVAKFDNINTYIPDDHNPKSLSGFYLYPIYPSPFNSQTTIRFELPVDSKMTLGIFDIYGRKIITLIDNDPLSPRGVCGFGCEVWVYSAFP